MNLTSHIQVLHRQRRREFARLNTQFSALTDALEQRPARWIGQHPYLATGSAALAGLLATRLPSLPRRAPRAAPASAPDRVDYASILSLVSEALQPLLRPEPTVEVADAGTVTGTLRPDTIKSPEPEPAEAAASP